MDWNGVLGGGFSVEKGEGENVERLIELSR